MQLSIPIPLAFLSPFAQAALVGVIAAYPQETWRLVQTAIISILRLLLKLLGG